MKITLKESDIKTLVNTKKGWSYRIKTPLGDRIGSEIDTIEDAITHAEKHLEQYIKEMLRK